MNRIGIIGGGFAGTMTAVHLIKGTRGPLDIVLFDERNVLNKGIAFAPYSDQHVLNVATARMGAFPDHPEHFLDWVMMRPEYEGQHRQLIQGSYLPRSLYGEYLVNIWTSAMEEAKRKNVRIRVVHGLATDMTLVRDGWTVLLDDGKRFVVDQLVIATGNHLPRDPSSVPEDIVKGERYFRDPWRLDAVTDLPEPEAPILIIGNGLTMVDTVLGLIERNFHGEIHSVSPNGFNILPHRHGGISYKHLERELKEAATLLDVVSCVNKHIKLVRALGISAEPIIDSIRPHAQRIWKSLSARDKARFMSRLRHLWGVARHRIPLHTHDKIQQLRIDGRLHVVAGRITAMVSSNNGIEVAYNNKRDGSTKQLLFSRIINCTGPETDLSNMDGFLSSCLAKGFLTQDELKLGIRTNTANFQLIDRDGKEHRNLYTLGSNLKGELWESTAVHEIRTQAKDLAITILTKLHPDPNVGQCDAENGSYERSSSPDPRSA